MPLGSARTVPEAEIEYCSPITKILPALERLGGS